MAHLSRWLEARRIEPQELDSERLNEFLEHRKAAGYTCWFSPRGLEPVLRHLRRVGAIRSEPPPRAATVLDVLLDEYGDYLVRERALASVTIPQYVHLARKFLSVKGGKKMLDLSLLRAVDITSFILQESSSHSVGSAKKGVTMLRSLLRYLYVRGDLSTDLAVAVPAVAGRRLVGLPRGLEPHEVRSLLETCDRRTRVGRRDFAALLLMVRLGLRACEVANLRLEDLHWVRGEVVIRGKRRCEDRLPLPRDVGEALVSYLKRSGPRSTFRELFLHVRAPHGGLCSSAVKAIVRRAGGKIGLASLGAHRLRHTAATQMLRNGASLPQIAQVLRHRHLNTTAIYAKVDRSRLRELGRPWPGEER
jgi:site-specific recombinase XerD